MFGDGGPVVDGLFTAGSTVLALLTLLWHWAFREGSSIVRRAVEREPGQFVKGCFAALPGSLMFAGGALLGIDSLLGGALGYVGLVAAVIFVPVTAWGIKELHWPTLRRTPVWLRVKMQVDARLRDKVVGRRTLPW